MDDENNRIAFLPNSIGSTDGMEARKKRKENRDAVDPYRNRSREPDSWHPPEHITKMTYSPGQEDQDAR